MGNRGIDAYYQTHNHKFWQISKKKILFCKKKFNYLQLFQFFFEGGGGSLGLNKEYQDSIPKTRTLLGINQHYHNLVDTLETHTGIAFLF